MSDQDSAKRIGGEALAIGIGQLISFAYPFVSLPFLARLLGAPVLGELVIMIGVLQLLVRLTDYGFTISAVRRMAVASDPQERLRVIGSSLGASLVLWLLGTCMLMIVVLAVPALRGDALHYLMGALLVGAGVGFPPWLLRGLERLVLFAVITAVSRLLALGGLALTVHSSADLGWALFWQFVPLLIAAIIVWPILVCQGIRPTMPNRGQVRESLDEGKELFLSSIISATAGPMSTVMLGIVSVPIQVGYFGAAERFSNAGRGVLYGIATAMMPRMAQTHDGEKGRSRLIVGGLLFGFVLSGAFLIITAGWLVPWFLGDGFEPAIPVTRLVGFALIVNGGVAVLELQLNAAHQYRRTALAATIGAIVHIAAIIPLGAVWGAVGAAAVLVINELTVFGVLFVMLRRSRRQRSADQRTLQRV